MRPTLLDPFFAPITTLPGIGDRRAKLLTKATTGTSSQGQARDQARVLDLLVHRPHSIIDRRPRPRLDQISSETVATLELVITAHTPPMRRSQPHRVRATDGFGDIDLVFFRSRNDYLIRTLPVESRRLVSGKIEFFRDMPQMVHPDYILPPEQAHRLPICEPVYPLTSGLTNRQMGQSISAALDRIPTLSEWCPPALIKSYGWPSFAQALNLLHNPVIIDDRGPTDPARQRLAFDEFFAMQLALAMVRQRYQRQTGVALTGSNEKQAAISASLPYQLTNAQKRAVDEITQDLAKDKRMLRLLHGDVGAGKTIVALLASAYVAGAGKQTALMAPTELLARQHYHSISQLAAAANLRVEILTGRERGTSRKEIFHRLASGDIDIVVGTHALAQDPVTFADLRLVIIDEQHRFGVHQRLALANKATQTADLLVLTATPIPRTLVLSYFGDMDVSRLDEKPPGRLPIDTRLISADRLGELIERIEGALSDGYIYWICPLVEDSDVIDAVSAQLRYQQLSKYFGEQVGIIHGQMKTDEKDAAMADFSSGKTPLLVATTVIEVGVDVPEANIIVIEHAERFGLAQLHQLRGRVGRSHRQSVCVLLYHGALGDTARARLEVMRTTNDGFVIAEEDLRLRGEGDVLGTRQSGLPQFRLADISQNIDMLELARDSAHQILAEDPNLETGAGRELRHLLYIFERYEAIALLDAG